MLLPNLVDQSNRIRGFDAARAPDLADRRCDVPLMLLHCYFHVCSRLLLIDSRDNARGQHINCVNTFTSFGYIIGGANKPTPS